MIKSSVTEQPVLQIVCGQAGLAAGLVGQPSLPVKRQGQEELLGRIARLIKRRKSDKPPIGGIVIIGSGGTFSESRSAVVVANTLAYAWAVPLARWAGDREMADPGQAWTFLKKSAKWPVQPQYSGEPNITIKG